MMKKIRLISTLAGILTLFAGLLFLSLPHLIDYFILPQIANKLPFTVREISVTRISPWSIQGMMSGADNGKQFFSIPRFELHFSPKMLLRGQIGTLIIDGATVHLEAHNGTLGLYRYSPKPSPQKKRDKNKTPPLISPLAIETIIIQNSTVILHQDHDEQRVFVADARFSFTFAKTPDNKQHLEAVSGNLQLKGAFELNCELEIQAIAHAHEIILKIHSSDIAPITTLFTQLEKLHPSGQLDATSRIILKNMETITGYEATINLTRFTTDQHTFTFGDNKMTLQIKGDTKKVHFSIENLHLTSPEQVDLQIKGEYGFATGDFTGDGQLQTKTNPVPIIISFDGRRQRNTTHLRYSMHGGPFIFDNNRFHISSITTDGTLDIEETDISGTINSHIPQLTDSKNTLALINISLNMPFHLPATKSPAKGSFSIEEIHYQDIRSGKVTATLTSSLDEFAFTTLFTTPFVPSLQLSCTGSGQMASPFAVHCNLPPTMIDSSLLPSFFNIPEDLVFTGQMEADSSFSVAGKTPTGQLHVRLQDGFVNFGETRLSAISFGLDFPHLPALTSKPSQLCTIAAMEFGQVKMSDARIRFRIENRHSVFLEGTQVNWCGGKVEIGGLRLSEPLKALETTLYCDRLSFTRLLEQFGVENTEGDGSLNGKIPIKITDKGITFDDGFLFSTPGKSGIIQFNSVEQLRRGMLDTSQAAYLDYSLKSLDNFLYNWTRLSFNSQDGDLLIAMQLDGKPAVPLPFGYHKGVIVPKKDGPGLQHPIRLDINFRLPLKDLFRYGNNIQSIMENM